MGAMYMYMHVHVCKLTVEFAYVCACVCVRMWGELVNHKRFLTHRPSSQGWAPKCPVQYVFVFYRCSSLGLDSLSFLSSSVAILAM